jgi:hypothetical protein
MSTMLTSPGRKVMRTAPLVDSESMSAWHDERVHSGIRALDPEAAEHRNSSPLVSAGRSVSARATTPKFWPRASARTKVAPWTMANSVGWPPLPKVGWQPEPRKADLGNRGWRGRAAELEPASIVADAPHLPVLDR